MRTRLERGPHSVISGMEAAGLLELAPALRRAMVLVMRRRKMTLEQISSEMGMQPSAVRVLLETLVDKGYLQISETDGDVYYRASLARKPGRQLPLHIQQALNGNE